MDSSLRRRLLALTAALVIVLPLSVVAARWQWSRHLERQELNASIQAVREAQPVTYPGPLRDGYQDDDRYLPMRVVGSWAASPQWLVRRSVVNGQVGFSLVTGFDSDAGDRLFVVRGWTRDPDLLSVPGGSTEILVRLQNPARERGSQPTDLPPNQINWIDPSQLANGLPHAEPVFELVEPVPQELVGIPLPEQESGPHVSYTIQWVLIGLTAIVVYVRVMRRELQDSSEN